MKPVDDGGVVSDAPIRAARSPASAMRHESAFGGSPLLSISSTVVPRPTSAKHVNLLPVGWVLRPGAGAGQLDDQPGDQAFERGAVVADVDPVRLVERNGDASQGRGGEAQRPLDHLVQVGHRGRAAPEGGVDERHQGVHPLHVPLAGDQRVRNFRNDRGGRHRSHFRRRSGEQRQMVSKLVQDAAPDGNELAQLGTYVFR